MRRIIRRMFGDGWMPGTVVGTMGFMSPEQVRGQPVDHRLDIFSFGTILYEMLSGNKAFKRDTGSDTIARSSESLCDG
jgi:eukaryotic-like serine/threonine-protein kinase